MACIIPPQILSSHTGPGGLERSFSLWVSLSSTTSVSVVDMDLDFLDKLSKISLTEDEELDITVGVNHRKEILEECSLSMLE
ncbi:hypothetical protein CFP56_004766 [Quercus suber]|uniref:Uncharacterized protein n=1 Tax=Quercus suber TaxID=58331 RepID=A0AAW0M9T9_QUESU